jgi:hypothetical protein
MNHATNQQPSDQNLSSVSSPTHFPTTKTIRFGLEKMEGTIDIPSLGDDQENLITTHLKALIDHYEKAYSDLSTLLYGQNKNEKTDLRGAIQVKHQWIRQYFSIDFHQNHDQIQKESQPKQKKISLKAKSVSSFLLPFFQTWYEDFTDYSKELNFFQEQPEHLQKRKADLSQTLRNIQRRLHLWALLDWVKNIEDKESNKTRDCLAESLQKTQDSLSKLSELVLPSQSFGLELYKASLNYYTVNKKALQDLKKKKDEITEQLEKKEEIPQIPKNMKFPNHDRSLKDLKDLKEDMKTFKAAQKKALYEHIAQNKNYQDFKKKPDLSLFKDINEPNYEKFKKAPSDKRKKFFIYTFNTHQKFCEIYKKVAQLFGQQNAKLKAIQKTIAEAERVSHWALLLQKDQDTYVLTYPREGGDLKAFRKEVLAIQSSSPNNSQTDWRLYHFDSLTLSALNKLCFNEQDNTFIEEIRERLKQHAEFMLADEKTGKKTLKRLDQYKTNPNSLDEPTLVLFYQKCLEYTQTLSIKKEDNDRFKLCWLKNLPLLKALKKN